VIALVRDVPDSFPRAIASRPLAIDVAVARAQHAAYVAGLEWLGLEVVRLPADEACPDCVFIEDTAVVARGVALVSRPGAASRRAEVEPVAAALSRWCEVLRTEEPASFDGGDCLIAGDALLVGLSSRSNAAGVARLREVFEPRGLGVVAVAMPPGVLHLKSVCAPLGDGRVLSRVPLPEVEVVHADDANVVAWRGRALVPPGTAAAVEAAGLEARTVDTSELRKADGALTCLSIVVA
jgi:dimethylargininase